MLNTNEKLTASQLFACLRIILLLIYALRCCLLLGQFDIIVPLWRGCPSGLRELVLKTSDSARGRGFESTLSAIQFYEFQ